MRKMTDTQERRAGKKKCQKKIQTADVPKNPAQDVLMQTAAAVKNRIFGFRQMQIPVLEK